LASPLPAGCGSEEEGEALWCVLKLLLPAGRGGEKELKIEVLLLR
jgi:hypothetical protein